MIYILINKYLLYKANQYKKLMKDESFNPEFRKRFADVSIDYEKAISAINIANAKEKYSIMLINKEIKGLYYY
jgi:hypothetical protein